MRRLKDTLWRIDAVEIGERFIHWRTSSLNFYIFTRNTRTLMKRIKLNFAAELTAGCRNAWRDDSRLRVYG